MFNPRTHEVHEWTLADFTVDEGALTLDERIGAIADHQCTPGFAKRVVRSFSRLGIDFYLQQHPRQRAALRRIDSFGADLPLSPRRHSPTSGRSIASASWGIERAWEAAEREGSLAEDELAGLAEATCALLLPLEAIQGSVRHRAAGAFPYRWINCYLPREHSFNCFDGRQLNANSLRYRGPDAAISALFRFATLSAVDFYTVCAALLMERGAEVAFLEAPCQLARDRAERDPWAFAYEVLPALVEDRAWDFGATVGTAERAQAVRIHLIQPLAALYDAGALEEAAATTRPRSELERRLLTASCGQAA